MIYLYLWLGLTLMCAIWAYIHKGWIDKDAEAGKKQMEPRLGKAGNIWAKFWLSVAFSFAVAIGIGITEVPGLIAIVFVVGLTIANLGYIWFAFDLLLNLWRGLSPLYVSKYNNKLLDEWFDGSFWMQFTAKLGIIAIGAIIIAVSLTVG